MTYSPDTLALNPELAKQLKKSKAKTPGGKGGGHTDDAQTYAKAGKYNHPVPRQMLLTHTRQFLGQLDCFAPRCGIEGVLCVKTTRAACRLLIEFLEKRK